MHRWHFIYYPFCRQLVQIMFSQFFGEAAVVSAKITQALLKPSVFGPIPNLWGKLIAVVHAIVHFALEKDQLP
jgi:hypothetical protein